EVQMDRDDAVVRDPEERPPAPVGEGGPDGEGSAGVERRGGYAEAAREQHASAGGPGDERDDLPGDEHETECHGGCRDPGRGVEVVRDREGKDGPGAEEGQRRPAAPGGDVVAE